MDALAGGGAENQTRHRRDDGHGQDHHRQNRGRLSRVMGTTASREAIPTGPKVVGKAVTNLCCICNKVLHCIHS
jgi:hypothetical protein